MQRALPLFIFIFFIAGVLAIRFWVAPDHSPPLPSANAPVPAASNPAPPSVQVSGTVAGTHPAPANPLLPPLPEVQVDAHPPHAAPAEPVQHVEQDIHLPPQPHPNASFFAKQKNGASGDYGIGINHNAAPKQFSGFAKVEDSTRLTVGSMPVQLFGVHVLPSEQRCGPYRCTAVAMAALKSRLARNATVFCRTPLATAGITYAICLDSAGADLGGYLVGEGLAKADPGQSYDYVGAEHIARDLHKGVWKR